MSLDDEMFPWHPPAQTIGDPVQRERARCAALCKAVMQKELSNLQGCTEEPDYARGLCVGGYDVALSLLDWIEKGVVP